MYKDFLSLYRLYNIPLKKQQILNKENFKKMFYS